MRDWTVDGGLARGGWALTILHHGQRSIRACVNQPNDRPTGVTTCRVDSSATTRTDSIPEPPAAINPPSTRRRCAGSEGVVTTGFFFWSGSSSPTASIRLSWCQSRCPAEPDRSRRSRLFARVLAVPAPMASLQGTRSRRADAALGARTRRERSDRFLSVCRRFPISGHSLHTGMNSLIRAMLPIRTASESMTTGPLRRR